MRRTRRNLRLLCLLCGVALAAAAPLPLPQANPDIISDIYARSMGNDLYDARRVSRQVFAQIQPAQILKVEVYRFGAHSIAGISISGVKFHQALDRHGFSSEIAGLASAAFRGTAIEEVDFTTLVPIAVGRGAVVSGDGAVPTWRTVFSLTVRRGESEAQIRHRLDHGPGVFWETWFLRMLQNGPSFGAHG